MHIAICSVCGDIDNNYCVDNDNTVYCSHCAMVFDVDNKRTHECFWCGSTIEHDDLVEHGQRKYHTDCWIVDNN